MPTLVLRHGVTVATAMLWAGIAVAETLAERAGLDHVTQPEGTRRMRQRKPAPISSFVRPVRAREAKLILATVNAMSRIINEKIRTEQQRTANQ